MRLIVVDHVYDDDVYEGGIACRESELGAHSALACARHVAPDLVRLD